MIVVGSGADEIAAERVPPKTWVEIAIANASHCRRSVRKTCTTRPSIRVEPTFVSGRNALGFVDETQPTACFTRHAPEVFRLRDWRGSFHSNVCGISPQEKRDRRGWFCSCLVVLSADPNCSSWGRGEPLVASRWKILRKRLQSVSRPSAAAVSARWSRSGETKGLESARRTRRATLRACRACAVGV